MGGGKGGVELDAESAVDLEVAPVVLPGDAELDDAVGDGGDLEGGAVLGVLLEEGRVLEGAGKLCYEEGNCLVFCRLFFCLPIFQREGSLPLYACSNSGSVGRMAIASELWLLRVGYGLKRYKDMLLKGSSTVASGRRKSWVSIGCVWYGEESNRRSKARTGEREG